MKISIYMTGKAIENFKNFQCVEAINKPYDDLFLIEVNLTDVSVQYVSDGRIRLQRYDTRPTPIK